MSKIKPKILNEETLYEGYLYLKKARVQIPGVNRAPVVKDIEYFGRGNSVSALIYHRDKDAFIFVKSLL